MSKTSTKVQDPNAKGSNGFIVAVGVILLIVAAVIGYIVWNGQNAKTDRLAEREEIPVNMDIELKDNAFVLKSDKATKDTPRVELYEDFSCPHCADLSIATDEQMQKAVEDGKLIVDLRMMNFLDGKDAAGNINVGHSTKAVAVEKQILEAGDLKTFWNLHDVLMRDQQKVAGQWEDEDFVNAAKALGASEEALKSLETIDTDAAMKLAQSNFEKLEKDTGKASTPRVIKDGKDLEVEDLSQWVEVATQGK